MKTTDCAEVRDRLPELLAGALSGEVAVRLQGHLAHCDACSAEAALISRVRRAAVQAPAGLQARVASAAAGTSAPHVRPGRSMLPRRPTRRLSWALAAGVLAAAAAGGLLWQARQAGVAGGPGQTAFDSLALPVTDELALPAADWPDMRGVVAGGAMLDDLSDDQLEVLLMELES